MQQKDFAIQACGGDKKIKIRRSHKTYDIQFCSPDYLQEYFYPSVVCGYTNLRQKRMKAEKKDEVGILLYNGVPISFVREKKHKLSAIRGYLSVGGDNFVAIESHRYLLWLLPVLLALILLLALSFCVRTPEQTPIEDTSSWSPVIEDDLGEDTTAASAQSGAQIQIAGFSSWHIPAGQAEDLPIHLHNPDGNPCYFSFRIALADTGETLYQSDMVPPGETIQQVDLARSFDAGTYDVVIYITTNALNDGTAMNSAKLNVTLTVS